MHAVVHGDHQPGRREEQRLVMRHVDHIDVLAPQGEGDHDVISPELVFFRLVQLLEIGRQRAKFVKISLRSDEKILVSLIDGSEVPHEIPDVRTHSELINLADIDRDAHTGFGH